MKSAEDWAGDNDGFTLLRNDHASIELIERIQLDAAEPKRDMNDEQLQLALAKMLPDKITIGCDVFYWISKTDTCFCRVIDTEWLHVCWLVEQLLNVRERCLFTEELGGVLNQTQFSLANKTWQQRAEALCKVKGA